MSKWLQMVQFECPRHLKSSAWLRLGEIHVPIFKPNLTCISYPPILTSSLGNGHTMLKAPVLVRSLKLSNIGPGQYLDGRPPGNTRCCCHFCTFVQFPHLQLPGVIRKGSPSIKVLKMEFFLNKISSSCCKWSNLNHLRLGDFPFPLFRLPLSGVIKDWPSPV